MEKKYLNIRVNNVNIYFKSKKCPSLFILFLSLSLNSKETLGIFGNLILNKITVPLCFSIMHCLKLR